MFLAYRSMPLQTDTNGFFLFTRFLHKTSAKLGRLDILFACKVKPN